ncbi:hypothetical protein HK104_003299 [Borealophlyctis nickersoniae]|nr:hypothetical protein HK104_003299 [Borealophlyctis nickersoniae]
MSVLKRGSKDLQILGKMECSIMRISSHRDTMFINEVDLSLGGRGMERGEHEKIYYGSPTSDILAVTRIEDLYAALPSNAADFLDRSTACKQSSEPVECLRRELEKLKKDIQAIESTL